MDINTSRLISTLRFPLVLLIIAIHVETYNNSILSELFVGFVCRAAVPLFFIISGFLFSCTDAPFVAKLKNRFYTLLLPFFLWMIIGLLFMECKILVGLASSSNIFASANICEKFIMTTGLFDVMPILDVPMWYIRNLFYVCCLYPIIVKILRTVPVAFIVSSIICYLVKFDPLTSTVIQTLAFFSIGVYISMLKLDIGSLFTKKMTLLSTLSLPILILLWFYFRGSYFSVVASQFGSLCFMYLIPCFAFNVIRNRDIWIDRKSILVKSTFFIYAIHELFISGFYNFIFKSLETHNHFLDALVYILFIAFIYIISLIIYLGSKKILPSRLYQMLNGVRAQKI